MQRDFNSYDGKSEFYCNLLYDKVRCNLLCDNLSIPISLQNEDIDLASGCFCWFTLFEVRCQVHGYLVPVFDLWRTNGIMNKVVQLYYSALLCWFPCVPVLKYIYFGLFFSRKKIDATLRISGITYFQSQDVE